jgi:hypothetical protein
MEGMMSEGCGSCGSEIPPRIWVIRKTCEYLSMGHEGVAGMYDGLARDTNIPEDKILYMEAAVKQRELAVESRNIVVPADMIEEMTNAKNVT